MKTLLLIGALLCALPAYGQTVCDVSYGLKVYTATNQVSDVTTNLYGVPFADVQDNHTKGLKVIDALSKAQDKGGPYSVELSETRACDGKPAAVQADGGIMVQGVTLTDSNKVARVAMAQADQIIKRYEQRAAKGDKQGWDHSKGKPSK